MHLIIHLTFFLKTLAPEEDKMYKFDRYHQFRLEEFNQPLGMKLDPNNRWVKMADTIPWNII